MNSLHIGLLMMSNNLKYNKELVIIGLCPDFTGTGKEKKVRSSYFSLPVPIKSVHRLVKNEKFKQSAKYKEDFLRQPYKCLQEKST